MAHTPGPWTFELDDDGITDVKAVVFVEDDQPGRVEIAQIEPQPQVNGHRSITFSGHTERCIVARAAIAKAEGK
jgi:hypothetical protein